MLNHYSNYQIEAARQEVYDRVRKDLPAIIAERELDEVVVVVVPRSKVFKNPSQLGFRLTIQDCVRVLRNNGYPNIIDGTECIKRHTDTKTTHLHKFLAGFIILDMLLMWGLQRPLVILMQIRYVAKQLY